MAQAVFRREERIALGIALAVHAGALALLLLHPAAPLPPPEVRMNVTLAEDAAPSATAPKPAARAQADIAPTLGTAPPAPKPAPAPAPKPAPAPRPAPKPVPLPVAPPPPPKPEHHQPRPAPSPPPMTAPPRHPPAERPAPPTPRTVPTRMVPTHTPPTHTPPQGARHARSAPDDDPIAAAIAGARAPARHHAAPRPAADAGDSADAPPAPAKPHRGPTGGNRIGADFLKGLSADNTATRSAGAPAKAIGPEVKAALGGAISRQLKPHWVAPQGVDADQLVTVLAFDLNPDGTLNGEPRVVAQRGIDDSNRPQARIHAENAIRAVRLAQPFTLPAEYYDAWKHVTAFQFDRKLSQ